LKKILFLFLAFFLLFQSSALAEISLRCEVDKKTIATDDELVYKLIISSSEKNIPAPNLPAFAGFGVISQAQSSTVIFKKSDIKTLLVYTYILTPLKAGKFKIAPSAVTIKDKTYTCEEIEIEVIQGNSKLHGRQPQEKSQAFPGQGPPESDGPQITL
jgi:hypothetical protein